MRTFYCAPRNIVRQASEGELRLEINTGQDPLISHGVFYRQWSELGAELSKQPAHLGGLL